jgi:hypothetical protein
MRQPDKEDFKRAMEAEIKNQWDNGNFRLIRRSDLEEGTPILPGVWALTRKQWVLTS